MRGRGLPPALLALAAVLSLGFGALSTAPVGSTEPSGSEVISAPRPADQAVVASERRGGRLAGRPADAVATVPPWAGVLGLALLLAAGGLVVDRAHPRRHPVRGWLALLLRAPPRPILLHQRPAA